MSTDGPWERAVQREGAQSLALPKQGQRAFVYASAPLVAKSSLKTRHKEAAEERGSPPSPLLPDLSRLSLALSAPPGQPSKGACPEQLQQQEQPGNLLFA